MNQLEVDRYFNALLAMGRDLLVPRRARPGRRHEVKRDSFRGWCGIRKARLATIGETHSEQARRHSVARLHRQIDLERAFKGNPPLEEPPSP